MKQTLAMLTVSLLILTGCQAAPLPSPRTTPSETTTIENTKETASMTPMSPQKLTAEEAKTMMDATESYILLDVRAQSEYDEKHIPNAIVIPDSEIETRAETELPDKDAIIFVYCRTGRRSAATATVLSQLGYTQIYDFGGIVDWPYETE